MSKKNSVLIDTNVIIRFLVGDHQEHYKKAAAFFLDVEHNHISGILPEAVFAESVFVLEKVYKVGRTEIADLLSKLIDLKGLKSNPLHIYQHALSIYGNKKIDIVDCLLLAHHELHQHEIFSFDKDLESN